MKKIVVIIIIMFALAMMPNISSAHPVGVWVNDDPSTSAIVRLEVRLSGADYFVRAFGACTPTPCDWGEVPVSLYYETAGGGALKGAAAKWVFSFKEVFMTFSYIGGPPEKMQIDHWNKFTDASGRKNYKMTETFSHGK